MYFNPCSVDTMQVFKKVQKITLFLICFNKKFVRKLVKNLSFEVEK